MMTAAKNTNVSWLLNFRICVFNLYVLIHISRHIFLSNDVKSYPASRVYVQTFKIVLKTVKNLADYNYEDKNPNNLRLLK